MTQSSGTGGDVRRDIGRDGEHQARRYERQRDPARAPAPRHGLGPARRLWRGLTCPRRPHPHNHRAHHRQADRDRVADAPHPRLRGQCQCRLDDGRVEDERGKAADVAGGVEEIADRPSRSAAPWQTSAGAAARWSRARRTARRRRSPTGGGVRRSDRRRQASLPTRRSAKSGTGRAMTRRCTAACCQE